ncbi:MAG: discoidin domain-containing protein [Proteobacteria bacterium]|nr:discoidin domain-containing protein [Pseudomonadota bacterium]
MASPRAGNLSTHHPGMRTKTQSMIFVVLMLGITVLATGYAVTSEGLYNSNYVPPAPSLQASASHNPFAARFAVDGIASTRWDTGEMQHPGQEFGLDLGEVQLLKKITLETTGSPMDYPRGLQVLTATEPDHYAQIDQPAVESTRAITTLNFSPPARARYVRLQQTGVSPVNFWSIHELAIDSERLIAPPAFPEKLFAVAISVLGSITPLLALGVLILRRIQGGVSPYYASLTLIYTFAAALLIAPYLDPEMVWGFYWLKNFSLPTRALLGGVMLLSILPSISHRLFLGLQWFSGLKHVKSLTLLVLAALSIIYRSHTVYGDGSATQTILENGELINWKEPIDRLVTALMYHGVKNLVAFPAWSAIAAVSILSGVIFWGAAWGLARRLARTTGEYPIAYAFLLSGGFMQLFFGNIENYSLVTVGIALYLIAALDYLDARRGILAPAVALAVSCCVHLSAGWLAPSLLLLPVLRYHSGTRTESDNSSKMGWAYEYALVVVVGVLAIGTLLTVGYVLKGDLQELSWSMYGGGDGSSWVPWSHTSNYYEKYTLLSSQHILAVVNELSLLSPGALCILLGYLFASTLSGRHHDSKFLFLLAASLSCLLYITLFNADLAYLNVGYLNEWDLFSLPAVPFGCLALYCVSNWEPTANRRRRILVAAFLIGAIHTGAWIVSNSRPLG